MGSSAVSQLQASAAQAITDLSGGKHPIEDNSFVHRSATSKRVKLGEGADMDTPIGHQLPASNADQG